MFGCLESLEADPGSLISDDDLGQLTLEAMAEPAEDLHFLPGDLDRISPGPYLAAIVDSVGVDKLSGDDVLAILDARQRLVSHHHGGLYEAIDETAHCVDGDTAERATIVEEFAATEIAAALSLTRRRASDELGVALALSSRLSQVASGMARGEITPEKARILSRDTSHLSDEAALDVVCRLMPRIPEMTTGELRAAIRRLAIIADPDAAETRYETSLSERHVVAEENAEGTAALVFSQCDPGAVYAARDHVNRLAKKYKRHGDDRTIDQIRADVGLTLLAGALEASGGRSAGAVVLTGDIRTFAELSQAPADLGGYGPVIAEVARKIAANQTDSEWTGVVTDPKTGQPIDVVNIRRRPTAQQTRKIRSLHPRCVFPGCRIPAANCDLDHLVDYARGGPTSVANQAPLCRHHHRAKHQGGWKYEKVGQTRVTWTSPLGATYQRGRPPP